jgi:hypothetical protein
MRSKSYTQGRQATKPIHPCKATARMKLGVEGVGNFIKSGMTFRRILITELGDDRLVWRNGDLMLHSEALQKDFIQALKDKADPEILMVS